METQTFLYWRAHGCQLHLYKEVFYADSDIFLCISCAQNKLELAGVGYPNLFSLLSHGQVVQAWDGSHALLELWNNWGWKEAWEVSSPVPCSKQQNFKIRSGCWEPCLVKCRISSFINNWKAECLTINFFFSLSCLNFFSCNLWHLSLTLGTVHHKEEFGSTFFRTH